MSVQSIVKEWLIGAPSTKGEGEVPGVQCDPMRILTIATRVLCCALFTIGILCALKIGSMPLIVGLGFGFTATLVAISVTKLIKKEKLSLFDNLEITANITCALAIFVLGSLIASKVILAQWRMSGALMAPFCLFVVALPLALCRQVRFSEKLEAGFVSWLKN